MPPDPAEIQEWLDKARIDLDVAELLLPRDDRLLDTAGFHAQQAAEKALKAFLAHRRKSFQRLHDLVYLVDLCVAEDPFFAAFSRPLGALTPFAVFQRYPGALAPDRLAVVEAVAAARDVLGAVERLVGAQ
jgi:HEPN domain-containing protein